MITRGKHVFIYGIISFFLLILFFYKAEQVSRQSPIVQIQTSTSEESAFLESYGSLKKRRSLENVTAKTVVPQQILSTEAISVPMEISLNQKTSAPEKIRFKFLRTTEELKTTTTESTTVDNKCECISSRTRKSYDFCYRNPKSPSLVGKKFNCSYVSALEDLKLIDSPEQSLVDLTKIERNEKDVIFVSAISSNHFGNFKEMYATIKRRWPKQKMLLYSLDLSESQSETLEKEPSVEVRKFDYSKYPKYVQNWAEYRFKALLLAEAIREYSNVWWIDSHFRWLQPKPLNQFYGEIAKCMGDVDCDKKSSVMMFVNSTHSNFAVLTEGLLDYFPTFGIDTLKYNEKGLQLSAAFVYLARTPFTLEMLKWHSLCALEEKCMNPPKAKLNCDTPPRWDVYANCFRYDQSSINLLMFNSFRDHNHYFMDVGSITRTYNHY